MMTADISRIILVYKLPLKPVMLALGLGLSLAVSGLGLVACGLANVTMGDNSNPELVTVVVDRDVKSSLRPRPRGQKTCP